MDNVLVNRRRSSEINFSVFKVDTAFVDMDFLPVLRIVKLNTGIAYQNTVLLQSGHYSQKELGVRHTELGLYMSEEHS